MSLKDRKDRWTEKGRKGTISSPDQTESVVLKGVRHQKIHLRPSLDVGAMRVNQCVRKSDHLQRHWGDNESPGGRGGHVRATELGG